MSPLLAMVAVAGGSIAGEVAVGKKIVRIIDFETIKICTQQSTDEKRNWKYQMPHHQSVHQTAYMPTVNQQPETLTRKTSSTTFVIANKNEIKQSKRSTYIDNPLPFDCCVGGSMTVPPAWPWWLSRAAALSKN